MAEFTEFPIPRKTFDPTAYGSMSHAILVAANDAPDRVKDGADYVCDGVADQVEINNAILEAEDRGGGRVVLSGGVLSLTAPVNLKDYVSFNGAGWGTELKIADGSLSPFQLIRNDTAGNFGIAVKNMKLNGNKDNLGVTPSASEVWEGVNLFRPQYYNLSNLWIVDCAADGIDLDAGFVGVIKNCLIERSGKWAIHPSRIGGDIVEYLSIRNLVTRDNGSGSVGGGIGDSSSGSIAVRVHKWLSKGDASGALIYGDDMVLHHARFKDTGGTAVTFAMNSSRMDVEDVKILNAGGRGIDVTSATAGRSGRFENIHIDGTAQNPIRICGDSVSMRRAKIIGQTASMLVRGDDVTIEDLTISGANTGQAIEMNAASKRFKLLNSTIENDGTICLRLRSDTVDASIKGVTFLGDALAIRMAGATGTEITGNRFQQAGADFMFDTSSGTRVYRNEGYVTESSGTAQIPDGNTHIDVEHGLSLTPTDRDLTVTPINSMGAAVKFWISDVGSVTFRINVDADPGSGGASFSWQSQTLELVG